MTERANTARCISPRGIRRRFCSKSRSAAVSSLSLRPSNGSRSQSYMRAVDISSVWNSGIKERSRSSCSSPRASCSSSQAPSPISSTRATSASVGPKLNLDNRWTARSRITPMLADEHAPARRVPSMLAWETGSNGVTRPSRRSPVRTSCRACRRRPYRAGVAVAQSAARALSPGIH